MWKVPEGNPERGPRLMPMSVADSQALLFSSCLGRGGPRDVRGAESTGDSHHSAADPCIPGMGLQLSPPKGLLLSHPAHVLKEDKEAQSREMSSPGPRIKLQFSYLLCVSLCCGEIGQAPGWEWGKRGEGEGREGRHIVGELAELEGSRR